MMCSRSLAGRKVVSCLDLENSHSEDGWENGLGRIRGQEIMPHSSVNGALHTS